MTSMPSEESKSTGRAPRFAPWISAALLYLVSMMHTALIVFAAPRLGDLWEEHPRLAALGWLAVVTAPIRLIAIAHRMTHGALARVERGASRGPVSSARALSAGIFGWSAMMLSNVVASLLDLALFPPPPGEGGVAALIHVAAANAGFTLSVYSVLWIVVCAQLYRIDAIARRSE